MSEILNKIFNGTQGAINDVLAVMFKAIADKYELDPEEVQKVALEAADDIKTKDIKMKPVAKAPRKGGIKPPKKKITGYQLYCKNIRPEAKQLLIDDEDERTWKDTKGVDIEVIIGESGVPDFKHINQKCADMWWKLPEDERKEWREKAAAEDGESEPTKVVEKPKSKAKAESPKTDAGKKKAPVKSGKATKAPKSADKSTTEKSTAESVKDEEEDHEDEAASEAVAEESNEPPPRKNGAGRKPKAAETPQQKKTAGRPKGSVGK